jgi:spore germination protein KA
MNKWFNLITGKNRFSEKSPAANGKDNSLYEKENLEQTKVSAKLQDNLQFLQNIMGLNSDVIFRSFRLSTKSGNKALVIYIESMVDKTMLQENILKPLMYDNNFASDPKTAGESLHDLVLNSMLVAANVTITKFMSKVVTDILSGGVILMIEYLDNAFLINIRSHEQRVITEPEAEILVRGPREGFTESLQTNIVLIRRKFNSPNLIFESLNIGHLTATKISIAYLKGIAATELVNNVKQRLQKIDIDGILESGYLEEFIEDHPHSPLPQIMHTERPDRVAGNLLEGRVAIITDGTPIVLIVPMGISGFLTSPEDYYERSIIVSAIRLLRYITFAASLLLPSLYIAISTFHQEMIPSKFLISITSYGRGVPFPLLFEALLLESTLEVLREAGTRLPRSIGSAVSIVGALVIGQAAVQAGLVSPLMVIIVAGTGIASFTLPAYNLGMALRLLRFPLMVLAGSLGLFGVLFGVILITIHATSLHSFGMPYLSPLAPFQTANLKDLFTRVPWWAMDKRPAGISRLNRRRQAPRP